MAKPVSGSIFYNPLTDRPRVKLRVGERDLLTTDDGGGGGAVSSVTGSGAIDVTPTTGATVVSLDESELENGGAQEINVGGLSGVLADPQLAGSLDTTSAAVDVSSAAPPTLGQVLTATGATAATWQNPAGNGEVWGPSPVALSYEDHFDQGGPGLGAGWVFTRAGGSGVITPDPASILSNTINMYSNPGANKSRVSVNTRRRSWFQVQAGTGGSTRVMLYRPLTSATDQAYWIRFSLRNQTTGGGTGNNASLIELWVAADSAGKVDLDNRAANNLDNDTAAGLIWRPSTYVAGVNTAFNGGVLHSPLYEPVSLLGIQKRGSNYSFVHGFDNGSHHMAGSNTAMPWAEHTVAWTPAWVGITFSAENTSGSYLYGVDFLRIADSLALPW